MQGKFDVGLDVGSVSVNLVIMNPAGEVVKEVYRRHIGAPSRTALNLLESLEFPLEQCRLVACTGMGGQRLAEILGGRFINEVIAQGRGTHHFAPQARTIIDMGGEDAKMIMVAEEDGHLIIEDFAMNTMCAAGTGSFLDQQAHRLGYSIEAFSELALKSTTPPRVAGRCSVFAKTDMIHLQQGATPDYEIIAGLCQAMARNLKSNIAKGKTFAPPIAFQGGVAHNLGVRQAFRQVFGLDEAGLIIPPHFCALGAVGGSPTATTLTVGWNASIRAVSYQVFRDTDENGPFATQVYDGSGTNCIDTVPGRLSYYWYKVRATNSYGSSGLSSATVGLIGYLIDTVAGSGTLMGDGGLATAAMLNAPAAIAFDSSANMYIADKNNSRIREVDHSTGIITTFAGTTAGFYGDSGPATSAKLNQPQGLAFDSAGDLYISDSVNNRIRRVDHGTLNISTFAGSSTGGFGGDDGPATSAALAYPMGLAFDTAGHLYFADENNNRIRKVDTGGTITTVAGDGTNGYNGDGIQATSAELSWPCGVAFDVWDNLYIADQGNHRIRKVDAASGLISTVAGNGTEGYSGDGGPATSAEFDWPMSVSVYPSGNLYIADQLNNRIRKVTKSTGVVTTLAGTGVLGFSGDTGPAISAQLNWPVGVTYNGSSFYIVDQANNRIRALSP